jgi:hypothetical protein
VVSEHRFDHAVVVFRGCTEGVLVDGMQVDEGPEAGRGVEQLNEDTDDRDCALLCFADRR